MNKRLLALVLSITLLISVIPTIANVSVQAEGASLEAPVFGADDAEFISNDAGYKLPLLGKWKVSALSETAEEINSKTYDFTTDLNTLAYVKNPAKPSTYLEALVDVPSSLNSNETFSATNKVVYSTTVKLKNIDKSSFYIDFDGTDWITSVFINGKYAGGKICTRMPWNCDITDFIDAAKEEQLIQIVVKSSRYAIDAVGTVQMKGSGVEAFQEKKPLLSEFIDTPWDDANFGELIWGSCIMPSNKGDHEAQYWGLTDNLSIVATSNEVRSAYADDVYVVPNVVDKKVVKETYYKKVRVVKYKKNKKGKKVKSVSYVKKKMTRKKNNFVQNKTFTASVTLNNPTDSDKTMTVVPSVQKVDLKNVDGNYTPEKVYGANENIPGLAEKTETVPANSTKVVTFENIAWADAILWWPDLNYDTAQMYNFKAIVKEGAQVSSVFNRQFGFRDVEIDGIHIRVNGVIRKFWNSLDTAAGQTLQGITDNMRFYNCRFERFGQDLRLESTLSKFYGYKPTPEEQMDVMDFMGIPVRVCNQIDGMGADFCVYYSEDTANGVKEGVNETLFKNFQIQVEDVIKEHRNHPANMVYSLENELMYINVALVFKTRVPDVEKAVKKYMIEPCKALDSAVPYMLDGGGAGVDNSYEIFCHHYAEEQELVKNSAKLSLQSKPSQGLWKYDKKRPYVAGEVSFFSGEFDTHCWIGGYDAGNSAGDAAVAYTKYIKTLYNLYRWNDVAMTCTWISGSSSPAAKPALEPLAVIRETYTSTFFANKGTSLKVKIFNDTFSDNLITAKWSLIDPKTNQAVQSGEFKDLKIEPGLGVVKTIKIAKIAGLSERTDYTLRLEATQAGSKNSTYGVDFKKANDFCEDQVLSAYPKASKIGVKSIYTYNTSKAVDKYLKSVGVKTIKVKPYLSKKVVKKKKGKIVYKKVKNKKTGKITKVKQVKIKKTYMNAKNYKKSFLKKKKMTVLVGAYGTHAEPGAGDQAALVRYAREGGKVIYLEQGKMKMLCSEADGKGEVPIKLYTYSGDSSGTYSANYTFGQGFDRPLLKGLEQADMSMWNGTGKTTEALWGVPSGSATSWVNANSKMASVALLEIPCDKGLVLASQLRIGNKINVEPAAQVLLNNILKYAYTYTIPSSKVGLLTSTNPDLKTKIASTGVTTVDVSDINSGLDLTKTKIMIIEANTANLTELNNKKDAVTKYVENGGWIIFTNLTDDESALAQYNQLLGTKHIVRPFRLESTNAFSDWTTIGLSTSDYKLYSKKMIAAWTNLSDISQYTWSYGVDATNDITPFFDFEGAKQGNEIDVNTINDRRFNAANICNYLSQDEHWYYMNGQWFTNDQMPSLEAPVSFAQAWTNNPDFLTLKHPEKLESITYRQTTSGYIAFSGMNVIVNGNKVVDNKTLDLSDVEQTIPLNGIEANKLDIEFTGIYPDEVSHFYKAFGTTAGSMAGIQEMHINRQTPQWIIDAKVKALNSSGTLVKYERNNGGFILNNVRLDTDQPGYKVVELSTSITKKVAIYTKLLTNLGAQFN